MPVSDRGADPWRAGGLSRGGRSLARDIGAHVHQVFVGLLERRGVDFVHRVGCELLDEGDAALNERQIVGGEILRIGKAVLVEVFNQVAANSPFSAPRFARRISSSHA